MPELPDISAYIKALEARVLGATLEKVRVTSPFLLRTVDPTLENAEGRTVMAIRRIGKRIAIGVIPQDRRGQDALATAGLETGATDSSRTSATDSSVWLVLHLMIAGRLHWKAKGAKVGGRQALAACVF